MSDDSERYAYSLLTDTWYRVTEWEWRDRDKGQIIAKSKTEVAREDVPQGWLNGTEERGDAE